MSPSPKRKWADIVIEETIYQAFVTIRNFLRYCVRMKPQNQVDPITLESPTWPVFHFVQELDVLYRYSAVSLMEYINNTGNMKDPHSQVGYSTTELFRLERLCGRKISISSSRNEMFNNSNLVLFLENDIGNYYTKVFDDFEAFDVKRNINIYDSVNWSLIMHVLNDIRNLNTWYCNSTIKNLRERIKLEKYRNYQSAVRNELEDIMDGMITFITHMNGEGLQPDGTHVEI